MNIWLVSPSFPHAFNNRSSPLILPLFNKKHMLRDPIYGAYTELYAALSPDVNASQNGAYRKSIPISLSQ